MGRKIGKSIGRGGVDNSQRQPTVETESEAATATSHTENGNVPTTAASAATSPQTSTTSAVHQEENVTTTNRDAIVKGSAEVEPSTKVYSASKPTVSIKQRTRKPAASDLNTGAIPRTVRCRRGSKNKDGDTSLPESEGLPRIDDYKVVTTPSPDISGDRSIETIVSPEIASTERKQVETRIGAIQKSQRGRRGRRGLSRTDSTRLLSPSQAVQESFGSRAITSAGSSSDEESGSMRTKPRSESDIQSRLSAAPDDVTTGIPRRGNLKSIRRSGRRKKCDDSSMIVALPLPSEAATTAADEADSAWLFVQEIALKYFDLLGASVLKTCRKREELVNIMEAAKRPKLRQYDVKKCRRMLKLYCESLVRETAVLHSAMGELERALGISITAACSDYSDVEYTQTDPRRIVSLTDAAEETAQTSSSDDEVEGQLEAVSAGEDDVSTSGSGSVAAEGSVDEEAAYMAIVLVSLIVAYKEIRKIMLEHQRRIGALVLYEKQGNRNDSAKYLKLVCEELLQHAHNLNNCTCPAVKQFIKDRGLPLLPLPLALPESASSVSDQTPTTLLSHESSLLSSAATVTSATSPMERSSSLPSTLHSSFTSVTSPLSSSSATSPETTLPTRRSLLAQYPSLPPHTLSASTSATSLPALLPSHQEITHPQSLPPSEATLSTQISPFQESSPLPSTPSPQPTIPLSYDETQRSSSFTSPASLSTSATSTQSLQSPQVRTPGEARQLAGESTAEGRTRFSWSIELACRKRLRELRIRSRKEPPEVD